MTLDDCFVALTVWREPDTRLQSEALDVRGETVHAAGKTIVDGGPITVFTKPAAGSLPAIVNLDVMNTVVFEVCCDPFRCDLDFSLIDLLVEEVPGTPT